MVRKAKEANQEYQIFPVLRDLKASAAKVSVASKENADLKVFKANAVLKASAERKVKLVYAASPGFQISQDLKVFKVRAALKVFKASVGLKASADKMVEMVVMARKALKASPERTEQRLRK